MKINMAFLLLLSLLGPCISLAQKKDPTCASAQQKFCEDWCENESCSLISDDGKDYNQDDCYRGCVPCCIGADISEAAFGDTAITSLDFDILRLNPQCKKYSKYWDDCGGSCSSFPPGLVWKVGYEGDSKVDICRLECFDLCEFEDVGCFETCLPCCKAKLLAQCYDWEDQRVPQCKKLQEEFPFVYNNLCFPADATVEREDGSTARMDELKIGDKVKVMYQDKMLGYEAIYQFGHQEPSRMGLSYVKIFIESNDLQEVHQLTLAETHYLTVPNEKGEASLVTAASITLGSKVWVQDKNSMNVVEGVLTDKIPVIAYGAYTPYTLNGNILVGGVVASSHNDWSIVEKLPQAIKPALPMIYGMLLVFHRVGYTLMGAELWSNINSVVDMSAPKFRRAFGSAAAAAAVSIHMYLGTDSVASD